MIESLPAYVSITFILTTFVTVGFLTRSIKSRADDEFPGKLAIALLFFWLIFQAVIAIGGLYLITDTFPPRIFLFAFAPALLTILLYFIFFRSNFIELLPLKVLTWLHVIRIPVELVLYWLFIGGLVPREMTFEGWNFDILSGITAPIIALLAFRGGSVNRPLLIVWNIAALALLFNIVAIAVLALPGPTQQIAFDHPNIAVTFFPFIWLPAVVVPIVFFSHLASLWKLIRGSVT